MVRRHAGRPSAIVNIASVGARLGMEMLADYGPSKAAVIELTHVIAQVGAPSGLRANTVLPGLIWTDMWRATSEWLIANDPACADATPEGIFARFVGQMVPMGRPQTTSDIAEMVAFLLSERAANITGQTMSVDGGVVMTRPAPCTVSDSPAPARRRRHSNRWGRFRPARAAHV
ncbi:SDR family oxidoreductase [Streptomyces sp. NBC_00257]|uniref:SDR family NAD(P)-dependent oxidoreductase n=1 Tax=unclassified Streptomyces TaxID=2593676 RepID=UPI0022572179|nr:MULTISPECIES: SDR family oxidoreductase [unclassified Streptomyces]MCX4871006.1 SDR family oxidoreductase [Streptomyces sp. NBC_00906]MCX4901746.1 SDR family oxidoreductase [Streptomyces sp. NBC_00892]MCX5426988.1 SDR family oxidoreductase [Streptomyces sp. NBC_00062]